MSLRPLHLYLVAATALLAACASERRPPAPGPSGPALAVATSAPADITLAEATLAATVATGSSPATAWFEWGPDAALTAVTETAHVAFDPASPATTLSATLTGLEPGTTYWYRVVANDGGATVRGGADYFSTALASTARVVVNTPDDVVPAPPGKVTLRGALAQVDAGGTVAIHPALDGAVLRLTHVGEPHTPLRGEVYTMAAGRWVYGGYAPRDYGASALYVDRPVTIDASALPRGVTVEWAGEAPARVLAVLGDLTLDGVTIRGGRAVAEALADPAQPFTLARGGGVAVWGAATIRRSTIAANSVEGDLTPSRDRGAFGGGVYADFLVLEDSVVSGNRATGFGAAGGGVFSVGGVESFPVTAVNGSTLSRCAVTGNRVVAQHAYGGGVYTDGGGPGMGNSLTVTACTVSRNLVADHPALAEDPRLQYYYRGGGIYMSNGALSVASSTITENAVTGNAATFQGKPNMGGGAIAATIGDAHTVESMDLQAVIAVGNTVAGTPSDVFTGSLIDFYSQGYNLLGVLDASQLLVPVPWWEMLSRMHGPHATDAVGVTLAEAVDVAAAVHHPDVRSAGTDDGAPALLWVPPGPRAAGALTTAAYTSPVRWAGYAVMEGCEDDFLVHLVSIVRATYPDELGGAAFGANLPDASGVTFHGPATTWPSDPANAPWIAWWRAFQAELGTRLSPAGGLPQDFWASLDPASLGTELDYIQYGWDSAAPALYPDQRGSERTGASASIGAIEVAP